MTKFDDIKDDEDFKTFLAEQIEEATAGLRTSRDKLATEKGDLSSKLDVIQAEKDAAVTAAEEKETEATRRKAERDGDLEGLKTHYEERLTAKDAAYEALKSSVLNNDISAQVADAINNHNGNAAILKPAIMSRVKGESTVDGTVIKVLDGTGATMMVDGNPATINDLVESMKADVDGYGVAFTATVSSGTGATAGNGNVTPTASVVLDPKAEGFNATTALEFAVANPTHPAVIAQEAAMAPQII